MFVISPLPVTAFRIRTITHTTVGLIHYNFTWLLPIQWRCVAHNTSQQAPKVKVTHLTRTWPEAVTLRIFVRTISPTIVGHLLSLNMYINGMDMCGEQHLATNYQGQGHNFELNIDRSCYTQNLESGPHLIQGLGQIPYNFTWSLPLAWKFVAHNT